MLQSPWQRFWNKLIRRGDSPLVGQEETQEPVYESKDDALSPTSTEREGPEQGWLGGLIADVTQGVRVGEVGGEEFTKCVDAMCARGEERLAAQWLKKFLQVEGVCDETRTSLRLRIVAIFDELGDLAPVVEHLEALVFDPDHACDAHYHLAEYYRRTGDEVNALREYEAVLARNVDYPNVKSRMERLRAARGRLRPVSHRETMAGVQSGADVGSRYLLVREIDRGASGVVYMARDTELERQVAVKLLHPHVASYEPAALERFFDEARVAASLRHPNIVAILDLDEKARRIVMEMCAGDTLRKLLRDSGARSIVRALERHAQILSALDAAHARGIVHRDLKPANLMFRRDPEALGAEIVLGDFGIAHLPASQKVASGQAIAAVGTMAYMSPEQRLGEATWQSDLYSSAVVLFEMLTAHYPWPQDQLLAGVRTKEDFALPASLFAGRNRFAKSLQEHINGLGNPEASERPDTTEAMKEARRLRDQAMLLYAEDAA